jgi:hypothetical protein
MAVAYRGTVQDGQIRLQTDQPLPEGAEVVVVVVSDGTAADVRGITGAELLASGIVGMWADREDIGDTAAFAEELRRRSERRE